MGYVVVVREHVTHLTVMRGLISGICQWGNAIQAWTSLCCYES